MKKSRGVYVLVICLLVLCFMFISCQNQKGNDETSEIVKNEDLTKNTNEIKIERWEYTVSSIDRANQLGAQGWELVGQGGAYANGLIFKRRLP